MIAFARGTVARFNRSTVNDDTGVNPLGFPAGYYLVRKGDVKRVARWVPHKGRWEAGGGFTWAARHWDEIGARVA